MSSTDSATGTRFQSSFDQIAVGIAHTTTDGRILEVNRKLCELLGYTAVELLTMTTRDLTHPDDRDRQDDLRHQLIEGERNSFSGDKRYLRKDGSTLWINRTVALAREHPDAEPYLIQTIDSIDERKRAEFELKKSLSLHQATLESTTDGILVLDCVGRVMSYNRRFVELWRLPDALMENQSGHGLFDHVRDQLADPERFAARVRELCTQPDKTSDDVISFNDGRVYERYSRPQTIDGEIVGRVWSFRDVSARKELERRVELTFSHAGVGMALTDLDSRYLMVNQNFADLLGYTPEELTGKPVSETAQPDENRASIELARQKLLRGELDKNSRERRFIRKNGELVWTNQTISVVRNATGKPQYFIRVIEDLTERKAIEQRYQETFDQAAVGIVHTSYDGKYLRVNRQFCKMLGYDESELLGHLASDFSHPDDREKFTPHRRLMWEGKLDRYAEEKKYIRKDGRTLWANRSVSLARDGSGKPLYFIRVIEDLTERKEADERYRATFDNAPVGIMHTAIGTYQILHVNPKLCEMLGYTQAELLGMTSIDVVHPDYRFKDAPQYQDPMLKGQSQSFSSERIFLRKDGSSLWVNRTVSLARDASGKPLYFIRIIEDITERKQVQELMTQERTLLRTIIDALPDYIYVKNKTGKFLLANKAWRAARGEMNEDIAGKTVDDYFPPDIASKLADQDAAIIESGIPLLDAEQKLLIKSADGKVIREYWSATTKVPLRNATGNIVGSVGISRDITEEKLAKTRRAMAHAVTHVLAESATLAEAMPRIIRTICEAMGWAYGARWSYDEKQQMLLRMDYWCDFEPQFDPADQEYWLRVQRKGSGRFLRRAWLEQKPSWITNLQDDRPFRRKASVVKLSWYSAYAFPIQIGSQVIGIMEFFGADIREPDEAMLQSTSAISSQIGQFIQRKEAEDKVAFLAQFDTVTDLPNRFLFNDRLSQMIMQSQRNSWLSGILFVDLDRFKVINDTHGHAAGDQLLRLVAARMQECVRSGDTVGRLSGDEFAVALSNLSRVDDAGLVAQKIVEKLAAPYDIDGHQIYISASVGIALYPGDGKDPDTLLKNADTAMYLAKELGRNGFQFYLPQMNERLIHRQQLDSQLRGALEREEFLLYYQPKASLTTGAITGFEALLRWQRGDVLVPPVEFISILEETGLIVPVGEWVLKSVCAQIKRWEQAGVDPRPVAVNLSARQFQRKNLAEIVGQILRESGVNPALIELELTESLLMSDAKEAVETLHQLKHIGVQLSVDDFGTGYSSLAYLKRFPLDELKIDREFIRDAISDPDDAAIALTIINLAHSLKLRVVAEGVETEGQLNFLRRHGCNEIQGYYFSRPQPVAACTRMLAEDKRLPQAQRTPVKDALALLLVVDNDNELQRLMQAFAPDGFNMLTAKSAEDGFESLAREHVDIVITDNDMPGMSGIEFLTRVRKLHVHALRVLSSSSDDTPTLTRATNRAGIHLFLPSHWPPERLCAEVRDTLQTYADATMASGQHPILQIRPD